MNGQGDAIATGSYNNLFRVFGTWNGTDLTLEASRDPMRKRLQAPPSKVRAVDRWCGGGFVHSMGARDPHHDRDFSD